MFDFNFWRSPKYMKTLDNTAPITMPEQEGPMYQIGKTQDGLTTLRIGYTTLTMTDVGVDALIRMLEAAKLNDGENK